MSYFWKFIEISFCSPCTSGLFLGWISLFPTSASRWLAPSYSCTSFTATHWNSLELDCTAIWWDQGYVKDIVFSHDARWFQKKEESIWWFLVDLPRSSSLALCSWWLYHQWPYRTLCWRQWYLQFEFHRICSQFFSKTSTNGNISSETAHPSPIGWCAWDVLLLTLWFPISLLFTWCCNFFYLLLFPSRKPETASTWWTSNARVCYQCRHSYDSLYSENVQCTIISFRWIFHQFSTMFREEDPADVLNRW